MHTFNHSAYIYLFKCRRVVPVSYTHLDVYKRQGSLYDRFPMDCDNDDIRGSDETKRTFNKSQTEL